MLFEAEQWNSFSCELAGTSKCRSYGGPKKINT